MYDAATLPALKHLAPARLRAAQLALASLFLATILLTYAAVGFLARSPRIEAISRNLQVNAWQRSNGLYAQHPLALDAEDFLLLRELPRADFSRGGVCFLGSSTMQHAVMTWTLPPGLSPFVHNFAIGSANYREQLHWARYLVEHEHINRAGPDKTLVVLGLCHLDTRDKLPGLIDSSFIEELFDRHGLYRYDRDAGLAPASLSPLHRFVTLERMRDCDFLQQLTNDLLDTATARLSRHGKTNPVPSDRAAADLHMSLMGGPDRWRGALDHQLGYLADLVDYLQANHVRVVGVFLPVKTWNDLQPIAGTFRDRAARICADRNVPVTDLSRVVPDDQFFDSTHLNYQGELSLSPRLLSQAVDHLRDVGLAPR